MKAGMPASWRRTTGDSASGRARGISVRSHSMPPTGSPASVASASTCGLPPCSMRTETADVIRPARSTTAETSSGAPVGAATNWSASERSGRPDAASAARAARAARKPPFGPRPTIQRSGALARQRPSPAGSSAVSASKGWTGAVTRATARTPSAASAPPSACSAAARSGSGGTGRLDPLGALDQRKRLAPLRRPLLRPGDGGQVERRDHVEQHPVGEEFPHLVRLGARETRDRLDEPAVARPHAGLDRRIGARGVALHLEEQRLAVLQQSDVGGAHRLERLAGRGVGRGALEGPADALVHLAVAGEEQLPLGPEEAEEVRLGEAGVARDGPRRGAGVAPQGEVGDGDGDEL